MDRKCILKTSGLRLTALTTWLRTWLQLSDNNKSWWRARTRIDALLKYLHQWKYLKDDGTWFIRHLQGGWGSTLHRGFWTYLHNICTEFIVYKGNSRKMQLVFKTLAHPNKIAFVSSYNAIYKVYLLFYKSGKFFDHHSSGCLSPSLFKKCCCDCSYTPWLGPRIARSQLSAGHKMVTIQTGDRIIIV